MRKLFSSGHLTPESTALFVSGGAHAEERRALSEHIGECDQCAELLSDALASDTAQLPGPPASFAEDTLYALRQLESQNTPAQLKKQYLFYCLRVGLAVCASLAVVFSGVFDHLSAGMPALSEVTGSIAFTQQLSDDMKDFSDKLINLEVLPHDKQAQ